MAQKAFGLRYLVFVVHCACLQPITSGVAELLHTNQQISAAIVAKLVRLFVLYSIHWHDRPHWVALTASIHLFLECKFVLHAAALAPLIAQHGVPSSLLAKGFQDMFNSLALSILGQQLAVKAAKVITGRFMALCQVSCHDSLS